MVSSFKKSLEENILQFGLSFGGKLGDTTFDSAPVQFWQT